MTCKDAGQPSASGDLPLNQPSYQVLESSCSLHRSGNRRSRRIASNSSTRDLTTLDLRADHYDADDHSQGGANVRDDTLVPHLQRPHHREGPRFVTTPSP